MSTHIIDSRDLFLTLPVPELQSKFVNQTDSEISRLFDYLYDENWLRQQNPEQIGNLAGRSFCIIDTKESSIKIVINFLQKLENLKLFTKDTPPTLFNDLYVYNRPLFNKMNLDNYARLNGGPDLAPPMSAEEEHLRLLSIAISNDMTTVRDDLLQTPPLNDKTVDGKDLLDIVCETRSIDILEKIIDLHLADKGVDGLNEFLKTKGYAFSRFISRTDVDGLRKLFAIFHARGLNTTVIIFDEMAKHSALLWCETSEMYEICMQQLSKEQLLSMVKILKGQLLPPATRGTPELFERILAAFESAGAILSELFLWRSEGKGLSILDYVCLNSSEGHLRVLLNRISDTDKSVLLFNRNYGLRNPLEHCEYYNFSGTSESPALIKAEMVRLIANTSV